MEHWVRKSFTQGKMLRPAEEKKSLGAGEREKNKEKARMSEETTQEN